MEELFSHKHSKMKKLLILPLLTIFLLSIISAGAVVTNIFYEETDQRNYSINNGNTFGLILSADSLGEQSMNILVQVLDSNSNVVSTLWNVQTSTDSYNNYARFNMASYGGPGNYTIRSTVTGSSGTSDTDTLTLQVLPLTPGNNAPVITSSPITQINESQQYSYQVTATDADNDALTYSLTQTPSWLSISNTGLITGIAPNVTSDYSYAVTVQVSDGTDSISQTFAILVRDTNQQGDTTAPLVTVNFPTDSSTYNNSYLNFNLNVNEPVRRVWFVFLSNLQEIDMIETSTNHFEYGINLADDTYDVRFFAEDFAGNIGQSNLISFTVQSPIVPDTTAPIITIHSPLNGTVYTTQQVSINYTAFDLNLNSCWYRFNSGINMITSCNTLFTLNAIQGLNTLTIYASDNAGNIGSQTVTFNYNPSSSGDDDDDDDKGNSRFGYDDQDYYETQYLSQYKPLTAADEDGIIDLRPVKGEPNWFERLVSCLKALILRILGLI